MFQKDSRSKLLVVVGVILLLMIMITPSAAGSQAPRPVVRYATRSDAMGPLRDRPQLPPMPAVLGSIFEKSRKTLPNREGSGAVAGPDPVLQGPVGGTSAPTTATDFEGINNVNGVLPPDTQGDVGPNHYVQMVNLSFAIWDKGGILLYGPADSNTLWIGFGGPCETTNNGDPIVLYDHLADRWMMSQLALPNGLRGPFYQCIAVSQGADPTGDWWRYEFLISNTKLNDYPKFGVWPDAYYMSINQFKCNPRRCNWGGQGVVAFERDQMLNGGAARMVYFDQESVDSNLGGMLPADLDGPVPTVGTPNPFTQVDDDDWGYSSQDQLQIWNFHVDWNNPTNSTFTLDRSLATAAFDANMCGYSRNCVPQPGGTPVDAISDRLMFRLQYRNFGDYRTMVANHTVDANSSDHAGIRWYELRDSGNGWAIHQASTWAPDSDHRWMGSIAMNGAGDIALGYSVSSGSTSPSIRFTGRLDTDTDDLGEMTQGEGEIIAGSGYQTHSSGRWGDYSMMSVDPVDDCTFWYTQEYYKVAGNILNPVPWQTRIGSFKLSECGPVDSPPAVTITNPADDVSFNSGEPISFVGSADDNEDGNLTDDLIWTSDVDGQIGTGDSFSAVLSDSTHTITASVTDSGGNTGSDSIRITVGGGGDNPPTVTITDPADGAPFNSGESISFVGSAIDDEDGDLNASLDWTSDLDDQIGTGGSFIAVLNDGTHTITASVTDSGGNTGSDSITITVGDFTLTATGYRERGVKKADLAWSGATSDNVDIYRNGSHITTTANDDIHTDIIGRVGGSSFTYQVCEQGSINVCSNEATVNF